VNATARNWPELLLGLGIIVIGIVIGVEASGINVSPIYAKVGPAAFLWFATALLALCGSLVAWRGFAAPAASGNELYGPAVIMAGLAISVFAMEPLGFVPTAAIIFLLTARGLGSRSLWRDLVVGIALSALAYVLFSMGLGLRLPAGSLFT
jgi:putative tricarboxylic transport membrane protein